MRRNLRLLLDDVPLILGLWLAVIALWYAMTEAVIPWLVTRRLEP